MPGRSGACKAGRMKRVVVDHFGGPEVLRVVEEENPRPGRGEVLVRVLAAGVSFTDSQLPRRHVPPGCAEAAVHARLRTRRPRRRARPGLLAAARGRSHRGADGLGCGRRTRLRAGVRRGRRARGPRSGRGPEPPLPIHDRLPGTPSDGQGEERENGARARRGRQGWHRDPRARSDGGAPPHRDLFGSRPRGTAPCSKSAV
jgi:hypothetical protein